MERTVRESIDLKMLSLKKGFKFDYQKGLLESVKEKCCNLSYEDLLTLFLKMNKFVNLNSTEISSLFKVPQFRMVKKLMMLSLPHVNETLDNLDDIDFDSNKTVVDSILKQTFVKGVSRSGCAVKVKFHQISTMIVAEVIAETREDMPKQDILCMVRPGYWYTIRFVQNISARAQAKRGMSIEGDDCFMTN